MSNRTLAAETGQIERATQVEVPEFGRIDAYDLRTPQIGWPEAEQDGNTPESIGDYEKARMTRNTLVAMAERDDEFGLSKYKHTQLGEIALGDRYEAKNPDAITARSEEKLRTEIDREIKFWHAEAIGSRQLARTGANPSWVAARQAESRHRWEARYTGTPEATKRRTKRIAELDAFIAAQQ